MSCFVSLTRSLLCNAVYESNSACLASSIRELKLRYVVILPNLDIEFICAFMRAPYNCTWDYSFDVINPSMCMSQLSRD